MNTVTNFNTTGLLAIAAADYFVQLSNAAINAKGKFIVALSGGSTPATLFALLATEEYAAKIQWMKDVLLWIVRITMPLMQKIFC
jgi:6-phosphogluconolactonase